MIQIGHCLIMHNISAAPYLHVNIQTMPWLDAFALSFGELAGYLAGLVMGRTFDLPPEKALAVGEYLILGLIVTAAVAVTVLYS